MKSHREIQTWYDGRGREKQRHSKSIEEHRPRMLMYESQGNKQQEFQWVLVNPVTKL